MPKAPPVAILFQKSQPFGDESFLNDTILPAANKTPLFRRLSCLHLPFPDPLCQQGPKAPDDERAKYSLVKVIGESNLPTCFARRARLAQR